MIRTDRPVFRAISMSVLGLVLAMTLSACGRKGGLDLPPGAAQPGVELAPGAAPTVDAEGRPIAPRGPNRRLPIDFLLD